MDGRRSLHGALVFLGVLGKYRELHEGWSYRRTLAQPRADGRPDYLPWMFIPMVAGLLGLWRPAIGVPAHLALATGIFRLFEVREVGGLLGVPVLLLGGLYGYGRAVPVKWARRLLIGLPPSHRLSYWRLSGLARFYAPGECRHVNAADQGNGVDFVWAPAGPGGTRRASPGSRRGGAASDLTADGSARAAAPQHVWRLPTVDETVRTMIWRGQNAGGTWNGGVGRASFRVMPDKEAAATGIHTVRSSIGGRQTRSMRVAPIAWHQTAMSPLNKKVGAGYLACRCVREN